MFCVDRRKNSDELNDLYEQEAVFTPRYELNLIIIVILVFNTVRVIAQTVSWWLLTAEAQVLSHVSPCEIRNEQSGTGTDSSPCVSVLAYQYHSANAPSFLFLNVALMRSRDRKKPAFWRPQLSPLSGSVW